MKGKCLKNVFSIILLSVIIITALNVVVSARYQYIGVLGAGLSISSSGLATSDGFIFPSDNSINTTFTVELQKNSDGTWNKYNSWSISGTGTETLSISAPLFVVHGTYRVVVTAKIYSSSGKLLETQSMKSDEVTY